MFITKLTVSNYGLNNGEQMPSSWGTQISQFLFNENLNNLKSLNKVENEHGSKIEIFGSFFQ